ncbi:MAG TPA: NB-ARC domain-containing protein [Candidatus Saccharimonadales bacterium]|nr:NB-ARC domain-containing protein [Candidatus Saccharimonadales bacterium]
MNFDNLTKEIQNLLSEKEHVVIAVSGFGGSGKTTLAERLASHFKDSTLLQLDNFLINRGEGSGWSGGYDWKRFEHVLLDAKAGKDLHYQWYDWPKDETKDWIDQPLPPLLIVEGVRLLQPNLHPYFDLKIWIDCSIETATEQGKARDRANKADADFDIESHIRKWDDIWIPKEKEYLAHFSPTKDADILYTY